MGSHEFAWEGDILDMVAPVSSCVQGAAMSGNHCFAAVLVYPRFLGKNIKYKGSKQMTRTFSRFSGENKYRTEEEVCEGRLRTRTRGTECTQADKSPGKVDGGLMEMDGANLGQMFVKLRRGGISIMMFNVGFR